MRCSTRSAPSLAEGRADFAALSDVSGISFRLDGEVVTTAERVRMADLDVIPSPYLAGHFDCFANVPGVTAVIETNRGCPYGCTFCDWGSNTRSRVREFATERVLAELEWCARNGVEAIYIADANFGIMERDLEIAEHVARLKETYGFPLDCSTNYAKNTTKYLKKIVAKWVDAGILTRGKVSLQSFDPPTLLAIRRQNIKIEQV